jgi:hypothetical protein
MMRLFLDVPFASALPNLFGISRFNLTCWAAAKTSG